MIDNQTYSQEILNYVRFINRMSIIYCMRLYQRIVTYTLLGLASLGFFGCDKRPSNTPKESPLPHMVYIGEFSRKTGSNTRLGGKAIALGDLDGDGDLDALVGGVDKILFYENVNKKLEYKGVFSNKTGADTRLGGTAIAIGDIDGDGDLDVVAGGVDGLVYFENKLNEKK